MDSRGIKKIYLQYEKMKDVKMSMAGKLTVEFKKRKSGGIGGDQHLLLLILGLFLQNESIFSLHFIPLVKSPATFHILYPPWYCFYYY